MNPQFSHNNTHLENAQTFAQTDPHLKRLYAQKYQYQSPIIDAFPRDQSAIVTLGGGRQIGKSTLLKQWMNDLLVTGVNPSAICFYSGELIQDHQTLFHILEAQLKIMPKNEMKYIILDEITDIRDWDKTVKYLADIGLLDHVVLLLSGSDLSLMQEARKRFPGRRGRASSVDFHYYPLSFAECLHLKKIPVTLKNLPNLYQALEQYLIHGGFLTAINDYAVHGRIANATFVIYSDWIRGDVLKREKKEHFLREIIEAIIKHYTKQVSWDNLTKELSIDHTQTIADYVGLLASMDAVFVQAALMEDKLKGAPKKRKKLMFCDPFIYHAMRAWIDPVENIYEKQVLPIFSQSVQYSELIEACVVTHFRRFSPTYYIKAEGEVDVAYIHKKRFWPVEVKWTTQLRPKDLKQVAKYKNAEIYAKSMKNNILHNVPVIPLPLALASIDQKFLDEN